VGGLAPVQPEIDATGFGAGRKRGHHVRRQLIQPQRHGLALAPIRFQPRHLQQLRHQVGAAGDALVEFIQRGLALARRRAARELGLQLDGRQGGVQFMGGVGQHLALAREQARHALQQLVERLAQRRDLLGQAVRGDRLQVFFVAPPDVLAQRLQRRQRAVDGHADEQAEQQHQQRHGHQQPGRHLGEAAGAVAFGLGDLHDFLVVHQRVDPPGFARPLDIVETGFLQGRADALDRGVQELRVGGPDLADEAAQVVRDPGRRVVLRGWAGRGPRGGVLGWIQGPAVGAHAVPHHRMRDLLHAEIAHPG
jgi:hypothetical protein